MNLKKLFVKEAVGRILPMESVAKGKKTPLAIALVVLAAAATALANYL